MRYKEILEACWKGYRKDGMKTMFGKRYPNCVKTKKNSNESAALESISEEAMEEDLKKWFKQKWVRFGPDGKIRGDCARGSSKEGKPKCLPQSKAHSLGKKGRASAAARKRRQDPNAERSGPAKNVATKESQIDELSFKGSPCTQDCSGHRAGYEWSTHRGGQVANSWSPSFNNGAALHRAGK